jgi:hypothetical protein
MHALLTRSDWLRAKRATPGPVAAPRTRYAGEEGDEVSDFLATEQRELWAQINVQGAFGVPPELWDEDSDQE